MKTLKILSAVFVLVLASSCNNDDGPSTTTLKGLWKLDSFITSEPTEPDFQFGQIRYTFDTQTNTVTIVDNSPNDSSPIAPRTYDFLYEPPVDEDDLGELEIDGTYTYSVNFIANSMILDGEGDPMIFFR